MLNILTGRLFLPFLFLGYLTLTDWISELRVEGLFHVPL